MTDFNKASTRTPARRPVHWADVRAGAGQIVRLPLRESDAALVAALRADPEGTSGLLFDRYAEDIERILYRILGSDSELYDVLHDVFLVALTSLARLRDENALGSWLIGIAIHKAKKLIRRRQRWRLIQTLAPFELPDAVVPAASTEASEALAETYRILDALPTNERIAFVLRYVEGMELNAIATVIGVSLATTKRRIARAQQSFVELARRSEGLRERVERGTLAR